MRLYEIIEQYADSDSVRAHMPGHKGKGVLCDMEKYDITEIFPFDFDKSIELATERSEDMLTEIYGTARSIFSTEGSSLCVRAMLYLAMLHSGKAGGYIMASRNAHKSLISAAALLDFDIKWLYSDADKSYLSCEITPDYLEKMLGECDKKPFCVYITSPDYLGRTAKISALARVCEEHGTLLVVDNAHGAYLKFLENDTHPITQGAHLCCDSAHKTLPALTGGAYLHISKKVEELSKYATDARALFGSTSPSYLILSSLDRLNDYLKNEYRERLFAFTCKMSALKERLCALGYEVLDGEPLKLVINASSYGYSGKQIADYLEKNGIIYEMCDLSYVVLMLTPENTDGELERIYFALSKLPRGEKVDEHACGICAPVRVMSIREALMSPKKRVPVSEAIGKVCASICTFCPPAVSIVVAGEQIDSSVASTLVRYGFEQIDVIDR